MDTTAIQDDALNFIRQLDEIAFEAYTQGESSAQQYRDMARQIGTIQRLTVDILDGVNRLQNEARRTPSEE